ncbi:zinc-binding oxidoreductase ToxD [Penicillium angulare]|uniref:zinc-binding oxidoreductase ToxD n=1 Tax=Penicillium angulare TaxID=116970 RepID=UPI00254196DA|nr:zinc-binding oxidoreductase ToxD [Penicillium angulare]KAJ5263145.1 zinc-binding oxidoreductase ToxD [Penicillium angulare]
MTTMKAIKVTGPGGAEIQDVPLPRLRDDYVLCRVKRVAINPTDWKHIDFIPAPGATSGCDFAGSVEQVEPAVSKYWRKGDRIAAFVHGCNATNLEDGCFAEFAVAKGYLQMKIPDNLSDEQAATLGVGLTTVGLALYQSLGLPLPPSNPCGVPVLIYGGSTATGSLAIQFAALSGLKVITTCSPRNFVFVQKLGASKAFNYKDSACGANIRKFTNDALELTFDCISHENSAKICCEAISSDRGKLCSLNPTAHPRTDVKNIHTLAYTVNDEDFEMGNSLIPAKPDDLEFGKMFWELATKLIAESKISTHPILACTGGLEGVLHGINQLREGKVSRKKLVYNLD